VKVVIVLLLVVIIYMSSASDVFGQVLINEFSSWSTSDDWVELINIGNTTVDLSEYLLRDSTQTNKVILSGQLDPGGFAAFSFSNRLNRSDDMVRLLKVAGETEEEVDNIPYGKNDQVCAPLENESVGRVSDGGNTIDRFSQPTKNSSNNNSNLNPCPFSTETVQPTVKATISPKPTVRSIAYTTNSPTQVILEVSDVTTPTIRSEKSVYGVNDVYDFDDDHTGTSASEVNELELEDDNKSDNKNIPIVFGLIFAGFGTVAYSFYSIIKNTKKSL